MKDRVIVITGATGATGKATARAFAKQGASLALLGTDLSRLDSLARDLELSPHRALTCVADLQDGKAVDSCARVIGAKFGRIDALIHLVGGWAGGQTLVEADTDGFERLLGQHAWTTLHLIKAFVPYMKKNRWGRVLAISTPVAANPPANLGPYSAAKAAQEALLMSLAKELEGTGVTTNVILVESIDAGDTGAGTTPDEIAALLQFLCSDEAAKINGARIPSYGELYREGTSDAVPDANKAVI